MLGGNGAAEHAAAVFGGPGEQAAAAGSGNLIATKPMMGGSALASSEYNSAPAAIVPVALAPVAVMKGGRREHEEDHREEPTVQMGGKTIIADVGVPAALIYARQLVSRRGKSVRRGRRHSKRRSNRRR